MSQRKAAQPSPQPSTQPAKRGWIPALAAIAVLLLVGWGVWELMVALGRVELTPAKAWARAMQPSNLRALRKQWPPRLNEPYPDLKLFDQTGKRVRLSDFKGKVLLVEMVGMNCPACQSWSGAAVKGEYLGGSPTGSGYGGIKEDFRSATGLPLGNDDIVFVQLLLYGPDMKAPFPEDARKWAEHFGFDRSRNQIILAGTTQFIGQESYDLIPGFQLVDRDFVLRYDATGHRPRHSLAGDILPSVRLFVELGPKSES